MPKPTTNRTQSLLASVTEEMLGGNIGQAMQDRTIRVEPILLELVRPDPVQPRRVLPERLHFAFHEGRLTQTQALRELVQLVQVAARQKGRPFTNVLDLVTHSESEEESESAEVADLTPEERLLRDLVNLAVTIRDDGQVNPLTVVDVSSGVTHLFRIETGERRYWATWIIRDFFANSNSDGTIPCIVVPAQKSSVFRQAKENTARSGLSAVAMARQAALLLLTAHDFEIPASAVTNDFYRQALELNLRGKREFTDAILSAMGGIQRSQFSRVKGLLSLSDEALELADRYQLDEARLRYVLLLPPEYHVEMVQQIIARNMTRSQVQQICEQGHVEEGNITAKPELDRKSIQLAKLFQFKRTYNPKSVLLALLGQEKDKHLAKAKIQMMKELVANLEAMLDE